MLFECQRDYVIHICVVSLMFVCVSIVDKGWVSDEYCRVVGRVWVGQGVNSCESLNVLLHKSGGPS